MKKLIIATAAILAATLVSGSAFAIPGGATKTLEASAATVEVNGGRHHRAHRHYHTQCCGYYSLYSYTTPCGGGCGYIGYTYGVCGGFFGGRLAGGPVCCGRCNRSPIITNPQKNLSECNGFLVLIAHCGKTDQESFQPGTHSHESAVLSLCGYRRHRCFNQWRFCIRRAQSANYPHIKRDRQSFSSSSSSTRRSLQQLVRLQLLSRQSFCSTSPWAIRLQPICL